MDMAMTLSEPNADDPFHKTGIKLGDYQFEKAEAWEAKGQLALVGIGVEPLGVAVPLVFRESNSFRK